MLKLSFGSNAFTKYSLQDTINYISYFGYDAIEILGDEPHINSRLKTTDYSSIIQKLKLCSLEVSNMNTNDCKEFAPIYQEEPYFISRKEVFKLKLKQFKRNVKVAEKLGCNNISISSGPVYKNKNSKEQMDIFYLNLDMALKYLPNNINLGIELEPGHLIHCLDNYREIFKEFNNKNIGINLDIGHLYCAGDTIEEAFEKYADKIFHIHLEDIKDYTHFHLILGDGNLPLKNIMNFLEKSYNGYVSIELYPYKDNPIKACFDSRLYLLLNN